MRIGYSYWGFLGDYKEDASRSPLSTPDGNASYSWSILWESLRRKHSCYLMQIDRDWPAFQHRGKYNFDSFSRDKRFQAYTRSIPTDGASFPDLDVLLVEWRFPISGRNTSADKGKAGYQPDLERQNQILEYYKGKNTKIVFFDLDHKLTAEDEKKWNPDDIFETSVRPLQLSKIRRRVEIPFVTDDLLQYQMKPVDQGRKLVYVGSRYERDDVIDEWIKPITNRWPQQVQFYGNWTAEYNFSEVKAKWPNVKYMDRITMKDFGSAYGNAVACPLIAKRAYLETGFVTARIWEAILFGTLPVGLSSHNGIGEYLPGELIANDPEHLGDIVLGLSEMSLQEREKLRHRVIEKIEFMDVKNFIDQIEVITE